MPDIDEGVWFEAFLRANVVPVFYVETLPAPIRRMETCAGRVRRGG